MRIVFIGTSGLSVTTAENLLDKGHDVVMIEEDKERIGELSEKMDCGFINGDGTRPDILREANPDGSDILFCLTDSDQTNIIASLVGRSQGYTRVITRIEDPEFDPICTELGIQDTIVPTRMTAGLLSDMAQGYDVLQVSSLFRGDARLFTFKAENSHVGAASDLTLPDQARVVCYYRDGDFHLADADSQLKKGDEVVILTTVDGLDPLHEEYDPPKEEEAEGDAG